MKKKLVSLLLCGVLAGSLLMGCNSKTESETQSETATVEVTETETETETEVAMEDFADVTAQEIVDDIRIGWSLGNTLDSANKSGLLPLTAEMSWGNPITTQEMIDAVAAEGFNAVRIPVTWFGFTAAGPEYKISAAWLARVKEVVDYARANDMYVIINMHHDSEWISLTYDDYDATEAQLVAMWTQIAEYFKGYDEHLIFEGMNEPRLIGTNLEWTGGDDESRDCVNKLNQAFVDTVRATGGNNEKRLLMVPDYAASSAEVALAALEVPDDDMICVSVHAYIPYSLALANPGINTWDENNTSEIDNFIANLDKYFISQGTPVIIGEMGIMNKDNDEDRIACATYYINKANEEGIPVFWWDNNAFTGDGENFGLLNRTTLEWEYPDLVDALMDATASRVK